MPTEPRCEPWPGNRQAQQQEGRQAASVPRRRAALCYPSAVEVVEMDAEALMRIVPSYQDGL
jgi:hypothetical protein